MTYLFYIICGMAVIHFIYERIILPSIRLSFRAKLFQIRDAVRSELLFSSLSVKDKKAAELVHRGLNNAINRLHMLTLSNKVIVTKRVMDSSELRNAMMEYKNTIDSCESIVVKKALCDANKVMDDVFLANSFFALLYLFPVVIFYMLVKLILRGLKTTNSLLLDALRLKQNKELKETILILPDNKIKEFSSVSLSA